MLPGLNPTASLLKRAAEIKEYQESAILVSSTQSAYLNYWTKLKTRVKLLLSGSLSKISHGLPYFSLASSGLRQPLTNQRLSFISVCSVLSLFLFHFSFLVSFLQVQPVSRSCYRATLPSQDGKFSFRVWSLSLSLIFPCSHIHSSCDPELDRQLLG